MIVPTTTATGRMIERAKAMSEMDLTERLRLLVPVVTEEQRHSAHEAMKLSADEIDRLRAERDRLREALGDVQKNAWAAFRRTENFYDVLRAVEDTASAALKETEHD